MTNDHSMFFEYKVFRTKLIAYLVLIQFFQEFSNSFLTLKIFPLQKNTNIYTKTLL